MPISHTDALKVTRGNGFMFAEESFEMSGMFFLTNSSSLVTSKPSGVHDELHCYLLAAVSRNHVTHDLCEN